MKNNTIRCTIWIVIICMLATAMSCVHNPASMLQSSGGNSKYIQSHMAGEKTEWHGFERYDFILDRRSCYIVFPDTPLPGSPWVWRARFPNYHPDIDIALLARGYYLAYMDVAGLYGSPRAVDHWDLFYDYLTVRLGFARKAALEGVSRGGLIIYNWAAKNPDKVSCIYAESPVCDFKSWPGGRGTGVGSDSDWAKLRDVYGLSDQQALAFKGNPIDILEPIAAAGIPILHVVSANDSVVPANENTDILAERYREFGGDMQALINKKMPESLHGHHFPLEFPDTAFDFIVRHTDYTKHASKDDAGRYEKALAVTPYGREFYTLRGNLDNCRLRFLREKKGRVAFLGGSITHNPGWQNMVGEHLRELYPETEFDFINAGIPSTGSTPGAFRMVRDVFSRGRVDLLFEEAAVNDDTNGRSGTEQIRGMEGIIRHARELNPEIDIVTLYFVDPGKMETINRGGTPEVIVNHEKVAEHYNVSSIDLALEVTERIMASEFNWKDDFVNLHPSPFGQNVYFQSIKRMLDRMWDAPVDADAAVFPHPLQAKPLDPKSYYKGRLVPITEAELVAGWRHVSNWKPEAGEGTRKGFVDVPTLVAESPGAELRFTFEGSAVGIFMAAGADAGFVEFSIDGGPYRKRDLFTKWSAYLHLPWAYVLDGDLEPGAHELILRVSEEKNPKSTGHAVRIVHFLAN